MSSNSVSDSDYQPYFGSERWVREVFTRIGSRDSIELVGLPGMGKTNLLRFLASSTGAINEEKYRILLPKTLNEQPERLFFLLVEFKSLSKTKHPFVFIYERFHIAYSRYRENMLEIFENLGEDLPNFHVENEIDENAALKLLERHFDQLTGIWPVFLFDDFDDVFREMKEHELTRLRPWASWASFVLSTSRRLDLVNPTTATSPFYTLMTCVRLNGLNKDESERLIDHLSKAEGYAFPQADKAFILDQAGGHPQLLTLAASVVWAERQKLDALTKNEPLSKKHHVHLTNLFRPEFQRCFKLYWSYMDPDEQQVLKKVAHRQRIDDKDKAAIGILILRGLIKYDSARKDYKPFAALFGEFLRDIAAHSGDQTKLVLTGIETSLYQYLQRHANTTCTFEQLLDEVWSHVDKHPGAKEQRRRRMQIAVSRLRSKLKEAATGEDILSIRDIGYRYSPS